MTVSNQKKIRDFSRLLKKLELSVQDSNKPEDDKVKINDEIKNLQEKITILQQNKEENIQKEIKRKHESRYHMVKFFERKKVTRLIGKIIKDMKNSTEDAKKTKELEKKKATLEADLTYIMYVIWLICCFLCFTCFSFFMQVLSD
jgi:DNA repair exonuclease SbcCD ATPase subunit